MMWRYLLVVLLIVSSLICGCGADNGNDTPSGERVYVGSVNSNIYHYPSCRWANEIHYDNEIWFSSVADAKSHGYRACKVCKPPS